MPICGAAGHAMLSILTVTTLFPNSAKPAHGAFVATRLEKLVASNEVSAEVLAPVPWLPPLVRYPSAGRLDLVPKMTTRGKLTVWHPRYLVVPKIGMTLAPLTLFETMKQALRRLIAAGRHFDLIDAHYFYPDGVAAVRLGRQFGDSGRGDGARHRPQSDSRFPRAAPHDPAMRPRKPTD